MNFNNKFNNNKQFESTCFILRTKYNIVVVISTNLKTRVWTDKET